MKGFKPTGCGMSSGFKFPSHMGFTGSTGNYTNVSPYVRRRGFAKGGFVQYESDHPETIGDQGSALVRRARSSTALDQESGGKTPIRPGFKNGGNWIAGATKNKGALHRALGVPQGEKIPAKKLAKAAHSDNPKMRKRAALAKTLGRMHKADGGRAVAADMAGRDVVENSPPSETKEQMKKRAFDAQERVLAGLKPKPDENWRHRAHKSTGYADGGPARPPGGKSPNVKGFWASVADIPALIREIARAPSGPRGKGIIERTAEDISDAKRRRIDSIVNAGESGQDYARGGKMKRMGYARGGMAELMREVMRRQASARAGAVPTLRPMPGQMASTPMGPRDAQGVPYSMYNSPPPAMYAAPPRVQLGSAPMPPTYRAKGGAVRKRMGCGDGGPITDREYQAIRAARPRGEGPISDQEFQALRKALRRATPPPTAPAPKPVATIKEKFYAKGGKLRIAKSR